MLTSLGWDVRRVRWDDWVELELDSERKKPFLQELLAGSKPVGAELVDRAESPPGTIRNKLRKLREVLAQAEAAERAARESAKLDFDV